MTLRGMTLGELKAIPVVKLLSKEATLGAMNGAVTGALGGVAMYIVSARHPEHGSPVMLALLTMFAMIVACITAGISGAGIPLLLRRMGADPATASSIFLTTITDVVSMGTFLALVTWLVL